MIRCRSRNKAVSALSVTTVFLATMLTACIATVSQKPIATISIPELSEAKKQPSIYLTVDAQFAHEDRRAEQDLATARSIRNLIQNKAMEMDLFERVHLDPYERTKADYRVQVVVKNVRDRANFASIMASGMTFFIIPNFDDHRYQHQLRVTDNKTGEVLLQDKQGNEITQVSGWAAAAMHYSKNSARNWPYESVDEYIALYSLKQIILSGIFDPAKDQEK